MAPTPETAPPKLTPPQATTLIATYLRTQNRPYSATDISANLQNRVSKTLAAKLLKDMHERREIEARAAGKQVVYHALQHEADETSAEHLRAMADETTRLQTATTSLKSEAQDLRLALRSSATLTPLPSLHAAVSSLEARERELRGRLTVLRAGGVEAVSVEEQEGVEKAVRCWRGLTAGRRRIRGEVWGTIAEVVEKGKWAEVKEGLGLEF